MNAMKLDTMMSVDSHNLHASGRQTDLRAEIVLGCQRRRRMVLPTCARDQSGSTLPAVLVDVSWRVRHVGHRPRLPVPCWQHPVCATIRGRDSLKTVEET